MIALNSLFLSVLFLGTPVLSPAQMYQTVHADTVSTSRTQTIAAAETRTERWRRPSTQPVTTPAPQPTPLPTSPSTTPPTSTTTPQQGGAGLSYAAQLENEIFTRINLERVKNGLTKLVLDNRLVTLARAHSADMIANNYFSHTNKSGCGLSCRFKNSGYAYWAIGENIYTMTGYTLTPGAAADLVVNGWMKSSGHRANILNSTFTNQGIGVAINGKTIDVTQDFAKPR